MPIVVGGVGGLYPWGVYRYEGAGMGGAKGGRYPYGRATVPLGLVLSSPHRWDYCRGGPQFPPLRATERPDSYTPRPYTLGRG